MPGRPVLFAGLGLALLAAGLATRWLIGEDEPERLGSSGGCLFAPASCPAPTASVPAGTTPPTAPPTPATGPGPARDHTPPTRPTAAPAPSIPSAGGATGGAPPRYPPPRTRPPRSAGTPAAHPPARLAGAVPIVHYSVAGRWDTGFVVTFRITNTSAATWHGWRLRFRLGPGVRVSSSWNARLSGRSGTLTATDEGWNGVLPPGATATFGLEGTGRFRPTGCKLGGRPCRFR